MLLQTLRLTLQLLKVHVSLTHGLAQGLGGSGGTVSVSKISKTFLLSMCGLGLSDGRSGLGEQLLGLVFVLFCFIYLHKILYKNIIQKQWVQEEGRSVKRLYEALLL